MVIFALVEGIAELFSQVQKTGGREIFLIRRLFDIEYVRCYALFRSYAGEEDSKSATCNRFGYEVKESDPVGGPYFDDYSPQGYVAVYVDPGRDFGPEALFIAKESVAIGFPAFFGNQIVG